MLQSSLVELIHVRHAEIVEIWAHPRIAAFGDDMRESAGVFKDEHWIGSHGRRRD